MNYFDEDRIQDLKDELGDEFLSENDNYGAESAFPMDELDNFVQGKSALDILRLAFNGGEWRNDKAPFNPNHEYFTFDGYGNLRSISEGQIDNFQQSRIDDINDEDFFDWLENVHPEYLED